MVHTKTSAVMAMADWLAGGDAPAGFTIDRDCELKAVGEEKAAVRYSRHTLEGDTGDEVKSHLASGKLPTRLAMTWDDRISFVLTERMEIKRLAFLDLLKEQAEQNAEHAEEQFDAEFALMTGELARFIPQLIESLGGEVEDLAEQGGGAPVAPEGPKDDDEMYGLAVQVVRNASRASISLVQRELLVGYNRAARLVERMEAEGIVTAMDSTGAREVSPA
jgi:recombination associated protein RdgC